MSETKDVKIVVADPSAIGLFGLAVITLVASSQKLGLTNGVSMLIPWALFLGAGAQFLACIQDFKHNNTFGATAFGAYGFFWFGMALSWGIQNGVLGEALKSQADSSQLGFVFLAYLIFTIFMTVGAMKTHKVLFSIFFVIIFLFIGLTLSSFGIAHEFSHGLAAYSELIIAILSFYGSAAALLNKHYQKVILPVGKPFDVFSK